MIHIILTAIAAMVGVVAAATSPSGFWTGIFVGSIMATSGWKWVKSVAVQATLKQQMKDATEAARLRVFEKSQLALAPQVPVSQAATPVIPEPPVKAPPIRASTPTAGSPVPKRVVPTERMEDLPPWPSLDQPFPQEGLYAKPPN